MPLFEMAQDTFRPIDEASFAGLGLSERGDIQRLLRKQVDVLDPDLLVLAEEFSDWDESSRRIDLLALDRDANLVVIELKRTSDGGHMELQALRYAAMVSTMTFDRAERIHAEFLRATGGDPDGAREAILEFLGWESPDDGSFAPEVRILLVSGDFGKELTTAVLWLREYGVDIRCVRLRPYRHGDLTLVDVQQVIPLPEAQDYQVQLRQKEQIEKRSKVERHDLRYKLWESVVAEARKRGTRHGHIKPGTYNWLGAASGLRGLSYNYVTSQESSTTELYIDRGEASENKSIFDQLLARKDAIEARFGGPLVWMRLDGKRACRIKHPVETGGYRSPEDVLARLPAELVDAMIRLEQAIQPELASLQV